MAWVHAPMACPWRGGGLTVAPPCLHAVSFVVLGSLNLAASLIGFWASFHKKKLLMGFLVCGGVSTLLQIGLTLSLLLAFEQVLSRIVKPTDTKYSKVSRSLNIARWVSLGFIFFEIFSLVMVRRPPCALPSGKHAAAAAGALHPVCVWQRVRRRKC